MVVKIVISHLLRFYLIPVILQTFHPQTLLWIKDMYFHFTDEKRKVQRRDSMKVKSTTSQEFYCPARSLNINYFHCLINVVNNKLNENYLLQNFTILNMLVHIAVLQELYCRLLIMTYFCFCETSVLVLVQPLPWIQSLWKASRCFQRRHWDLHSTPWERKRKVTCHLHWGRFCSKLLLPFSKWKTEAWKGLPNLPKW